MEAFYLCAFLYSIYCIYTPLQLIDVWPGLGTTACMLQLFPFPWPRNIRGFLYSMYIKQCPSAAFKYTLHYTLYTINGRHVFNYVNDRPT